MSQTQLEAIFQTQGVEDLALQHRVFKKLRYLGVCNSINPWYSAAALPKSNVI